jgi:hypothetical protein
MIKQILLSSAIMQSVGQCSPTTEQAMPSDTMNRIADAIFCAEGGSKTPYPYGIKSVKTSTPRHICINTIQHAWKDFEGDGARTGRNDLQVIKPLSCKVSLPFIQFLGARYCPSSVDYVGYRNWTNNVFKIVNKQTK